VDSNKEVEKTGDRDELGRFVPGHSPAGGRSPGTPNKFTLIKNSFAELWDEEDVKNKIRDLILKTDDPKLVEKFVNWIVGMIPKETKTELDIKPPLDINVIFNHEPGGNDA